MANLTDDLRYALRVLGRAPGFTAVVLTTLALTIAANTIVFSIVNALLLRPLPYPDVDRLLRVYQQSSRPDDYFQQVSPALSEQLRAGTRQLSGVAAYVEDGFNLEAANAQQRVAGAYASAELFRVVGVPPAQGRVFDARESSNGAPIVLIAHDLAQRLGDGVALGATVKLDGVAYTVIGVMPPGFRFAENANLWIPLGAYTSGRPADQRTLSMVARLRDGATLEQAQLELASLSRGLLPPGDPATTYTLKAHAFGAGRDDGLGPVVLMLLGAVIFVLMIACANVANLMLARAASRQREIGLRAALGATRARLLRQLLSESVLLAFAGGALGLLLADWLIGITIAFLLPVEYMPAWMHFGIDARVATFTALIALATVVVFGLLPAWHATASDLHSALKQGAAALAGVARGLELRRTLIVAQVAASIVLLAGAGLMLRSVDRFRGIDRGFDASQVLAFKITAPATTRTQPAQVAALAQQLTERLRGVAGVEQVAIFGGAAYPGGGRLPPDLRRAGGTAPARAQPLLRYQLVTPEYFGVLRIPLLRGRGLLDGDRAGTLPVALVDRAAATRLWPGEDPIGKQLRMDGSDPNSPWVTVVGIVGDVRAETINASGIGAAAVPQIYLPFAQQSDRLLNVMVRTSSATPMALSELVTAALREVDPSLPPYQFMPMERETQIFARFLSAISVMLAGFAAAALLLAAIGIYGVVAFTVGQRTREFGIRIALGARADQVRALVVRQGGRPVAWGIAIGVVLAMLLTRALRILLFEVGSLDPLTFSAATLLLAGVGLLATWLPARRATRIDPLAALRLE